MYTYILTIPSKKHFHELKKQIEVIGGVIEESTEYIEDLRLSQIADKAYDEYEKSGRKSRPFSELLKEL